MNVKRKILIVEDDPYLGYMMKECFEERGYLAFHATDGDKGLEAYCDVEPDVCVLDIMMPKKDGYSLAEEIRKIDQKTPILFTTSKSLKEDILKGFAVGADDYIKKPFSMEELLARVSAVLKRTYPQNDKPSEEPTKIGKYDFIPKRQLLKLKNREIKLTPKESDLLKLLSSNKNNLIDREMVLKMLWGDDSYFNARSMDVFITKLRKHLSEDQSIEIVNIRGQGYKLIV